MKLRTNKIILVLLIIIFLIYNLFWIFNYSDDFNSEDMILLGTTISYMKKSMDTGLEFNDVYYNKSQPVIPYLNFLGLVLFNNVFTPHIINNIFIIILVLSTYSLSKKIYNNKAALISSFLILTTPGIIAYSRTLYEASILMSLFTLNVYLYLKTDYFKNFKWTIAWSISAVISLLGRYTMIPYIGSVILFNMFFIIREALIKAKYQIDRIFLKKFLSERLMNFMLTLLLIVILVLPHYVQENNLASYLSRAGDLTGKEYLEWKLKLICDALNYPAFLINTQLGFILSLFLIGSIICIFAKVHKIMRDEVLLLFIITFVYLFYSFLIPIKNNVVTGMLIPLMIVLIAGFVSKFSRSLRIVTLIILILNGFIFIAPIKFNDSALEIHFLTRLGSKISCKFIYTDYFVSATYKVFNKDIKLNRVNSLFYKEPDRLIHEISKLISNKKQSKNVRLLDLTGINHYELEFYTLLEDDTIEFKYTRCQDLHNVTISYLRFIDFILLSSNTYNQTNIDCYGCFSQMEVEFCDKLREHVKNNTQYKLIEAMYFDNENTVLSLFKNVN